MLRRSHPPYQRVILQRKPLQLLPLPPFTLNRHLCILLVGLALLLQLLRPVDITPIVLMEIIDLHDMVLRLIFQITQ